MCCPRLTSLTAPVLVSVSVLIQYLLPFVSSMQVTPFFKLEVSGQKPLLAPDMTVDQMLSSLAWENKDAYYYNDVKSRIESIISPTCRSEVIYLTAEWSDDVDIFKTDTDTGTTSPLITVLRLPAAEAIQRFWQQIPPPTQMRTDLAMCNDTWYNKGKRPLFRPTVRNRICQEVLHTAAPRCQPQYLEAMCFFSMADTESTTVNHFYLPEANHILSFSPPEPYLIRIKNARVAMCGQVSLSCGSISPATLCDRATLLVFAKLFHKGCSAAAVETASTATKLISAGDEAGGFTGAGAAGAGADAGTVPTSECVSETPYGSTLLHYDRVFVVAQPDDSHIYHVQMEVLPKISYHLDFLLANPDVKILIGCDFSKKMKKESRRKSIRFQKLGLLPILDILGLSIDRFIFWQNVVAKEVYLPSEGACQDPVHNTWQILTMRHQVLNKLNLISGVHSFEHTSSKDISGTLTDSAANNADTDDENASLEHSGTQKKPVLLLIKRSKRSTSTRQRKDGFRQWSDEFTSNMIVLLKETFPRYQIKLYSDMDSELMNSVPKQIALFHEAAVVIGVHGAGLGHMLYMKPNSIVVEIAPTENDGRLHLGGGPFNRLSTLLAHNYLIHFPLKSELVFKEREIEFDIQRLATHVKAFITSLER